MLHGLTLVCGQWLVSQVTVSEGCMALSKLVCDGLPSYSWDNWGFLLHGLSSSSRIIQACSHRSSEFQEQGKTHCTSAISGPTFLMFAKVK